MKGIKKIFTIAALSFAMLATSVSVQNVVGTQETVQAATIKLNKKTVTLDVGKTQKLKVSGTKAKVRWSSTNVNVAKVDKNGTVTAISSGRVTIKAKVGKKTLSCLVIVKESFSADQATKNISVTLQDIGRGVVAILKNNNNITVNVDAKLVYYLNGRMIDTSSDSDYAFESGSECALFFNAPMDADYNYVTYDDYKIVLSVEKASGLVCDVKNINIESNVGSDNVTAEIFNDSGKEFEYIKIAVVYYDASGHAIGYEYHYANCLKADSVDYLSFDFPYDSNYETMYPDSYKVYVNEAYAYN